MTCLYTDTIQTPLHVYADNYTVCCSNFETCVVCMHDTTVCVQSKRLQILCINIKYVSGII